MYSSVNQTREKLDFLNKEHYWDIIRRHGIWILLFTAMMLLFSPQKEEFATIMLIIVIELLATALSGLSAYIYTRIDFPTHSQIVLGHIFLGVHLCVGLTVLGVYFVQFG